jgi:hypothetical protein
LTGREIQKFKILKQIIKMEEIYETDGILFILIDNSNHSVQVFDCGN